jgi:hypothetical protein
VCPDTLRGSLMMKLNGIMAFSDLLAFSLLVLFPLEVEAWLTSSPK